MTGLVSTFLNEPEATNLYDQGGQALRDRFAEHHAALRQIARARLRRINAITLLGSVDLVNDVFVKLGRAAPPEFDDDQHFLAYISTTMRTLIIDYVRAQNALRRGDGAQHTELVTENLAPSQGESLPENLLEINDALTALRGLDSRMADVVEMRFFGGFTEEEIATAIGVTSRTVKRDWEKARVILLAMLNDG